MAHQLVSLSDESMVLIPSPELRLYENMIIISNDMVMGAEI